MAVNVSRSNSSIDWAGGVTLTLIALTLAMSYGIWYAYGVFLVALLNEFGWSRSLLAGAFSLFALVQGGVNPLLGTLCDRVSPPWLMAFGGCALALALCANSYITQPWQLYVFFGAGTALAVACCGWIPAVVLVQRRFHPRVGLPLGIVSSGVGVGMLLIVPLCQVLIDLHGWRIALRVLAIICVAFIAPSALYLRRQLPVAARPARAVLRNNAAGTASNDKGTVTLRQAIRALPFWLMVATFFFGSLCSQMLHVHQVAFLVDHGLSALVAASVVGVVGVSSIVGKTGGGWLSDRIEREKIYVCGIVVLVLSVGALMRVGAAPSIHGAYLYAVMLGIGYSATAALTPAMVADRFGGPHFGAILGVGLLGSASGSALGPWLAGHLFDLYGSYAVPFRLAATAGVLAGVCGWLARHLRRRELSLARLRTTPMIAE